MKKLLPILLLTGLISYANERDNNYYVLHAGYYDRLTVIPLSLCALNPNTYTCCISSLHLKQILALTAGSIASAFIFRYAWNKWYFKKRKKRYCLQCLSDLEIWELVDRKKIVDSNDCFVCGVQ